MNAIGNRRVGQVSCLSFCLLLSAPVLSADSGASAVLAQYSDLACGERVRTDSVRLIDLRDLVNDKTRAVEYVWHLVPDHGIESPIPLLIEKPHVERKVRREALLRDTMREGAARGCDLAILLDIEIIEKVMYRPELMDLKLDVSYVLVLFGSQVRNSGIESRSH